MNRAPRSARRGTRTWSARADCATAAASRPGGPTRAPRRGLRLRAARPARSPAAWGLRPGRGDGGGRARPERAGSSTGANRVGARPHDSAARRRRPARRGACGRECRTTGKARGLRSVGTSQETAHLAPGRPPTAQGGEAGCSVARAPYGPTRPRSRASRPGSGRRTSDVRRGAMTFGDERGDVVRSASPPQVHVRASTARRAKSMAPSGLSPEVSVVVDSTVNPACWSRTAICSGRRRWT